VKVADEFADLVGQDEIDRHSRRDVKESGGWFAKEAERDHTGHRSGHGWRRKKAIRTRARDRDSIEGTVDGDNVTVGHRRGIRKRYE